MQNVHDKFPNPAAAAHALGILGHFAHIVDQECMILLPFHLIFRGQTFIILSVLLFLLKANKIDAREAPLATPTPPHPLAHTPPCLTLKILSGLGWLLGWGRWAGQLLQRALVSGRNWLVTSPQPPHRTSTTTLLPRLLLLLPLLLFSFSQDTAGDQILFVSVSAIGDQIPE